MNRNFRCDVDGQVVPAGTVSAATKIDNSKTAADVLIYNPGPGVVYAKAGFDATVQASAINAPIPPGTSQVFFKGTAQWLALQSPSGAQNCTVIPSEGI